jgi:nicotinate dehydrogenase subunit B
MDTNISRRGALLGAVGLGLTIRFASAQNAPPVPAMLQANPRLDAWVRIGPDGAITVMTGRVELGQGVLTAMKQIAAEELDVAPERLTLVSGDTARTPNEGVTAGSQSIRFGGVALAQACADARHSLLGVAAEAWRLERAALRVEDGVILAPDGRRMPYGEAAARVSLDRPVDVAVPRKPAGALRIVGSSMPRTDIPAKLFGAEVFIHDMRPEGMLFGAVARPPGYAARLSALDEAAARALPGVSALVRDGSFLGVLCAREEHALAAAKRIERMAQWREGEPLFGGRDVFDHLLGDGAERRTIHETDGAAGAVVRRHSAEYRRGFQAHASIGASCALARWDSEGRLTVWSHTQGPFPLRGDLARALRIEPARVRVIHVQGSGCYGHNGADDVALDAALLARAVPGRTVRVHWSHEEEMVWAPWSSAMVTRLAAGLDAQGRLVEWTHEVFSFPHSTRPGGADPGTNLRSAWYLADPVPPRRAVDGPLPNGASARNAVPVYAVPKQTVRTHFHAAMPIRTSALRTLGGFFNVVAAEMFMDEMAALAGQDPVAFRRAHLADPRLVAVLDRAVAISGWRPRVPGGPQREGATLAGWGVGVSKYKNSDAHCACVARVAVEPGTGATRILGIWSATEAGRLVNPDGVLNQIDGGIVQAVSWALREEGAWDRNRLISEDYAAYPIQDFSTTPPIESVLLDRPELPSLGVGEGSQGPAAAAIANAIRDATGRHVTRLPFTAERVRAVM